MAARERRQSGESCFNNLVMFFGETIVFTWCRGEVCDSSSLSAFFVTSVDLNETSLASQPHLWLRSERSLWSWPIEVDNCRRATTNCLLCAALTCLYLLGLQCCLGTRQQCVCAFACVCVAGGRCIGVTVQFSEMPTAASKKEKKERENKNEGGKCRLSVFTLLCFTFFPKQESRGCQQRWQLFAWQIH